jgi:hypothetical protein
MHPSTKTSKPAQLLLAIGLTIATQFTAIAPDHSVAARVWPQTEPLASSAACLPLATAVPPSDFSPYTTASVAQPATCDRCRTICARNCASYACIACAKTIKCRSTVQACVRTKRRF